MFFEEVPNTIIRLKTTGAEEGREEIKEIKSVSGQHVRLQKGQRHKKHGTVEKEEVLPVLISNPEAGSSLILKDGTCRGEARWEDK